jgi:hypothetical protein
LRLTDAADVRLPVQLTLAEAQSATNFVVMAPSWLPSGCTLGVSSLREEQPPGRPSGVDRAAMAQTPWSVANPCSIRTIVQGAGRALRIKQFLYDWSPPAAGVAPLWDSPQLDPFECDSSIGWMGIDYRGASGACTERDRTQVELSCVEGAFERSEIMRLLRSMNPSNPQRALAVQGAPFHRLSYWARYRFTPYKSPCSFIRNQDVMNMRGISLSRS